LPAIVGDKHYMLAIYLQNDLKKPDFFLDQEQTFEKNARLVHMLWLIIIKPTEKLKVVWVDFQSLR
jgi:hypothetical protein